MREEDVQLLITSIETLTLQPSEDFVERTRQRISDELHTISGAEFGSIDVLVDLDATMVDEEPEDAKRDRSHIGLVAALIAACLIGIVAIRTVRSDDLPLKLDVADDSDAGEDRPIDVTDLESGSEAAVAFAVVEDAYAAHAAGDAEAWFIARFAGAEFSSESERQAERGRLEANLALGEEIEIFGCEFLGFSDWPLFLDSGELASGYRFRCETLTADTILRSAGVGLGQITDWVVSNGQVIGVMVSNQNQSDVASFDIEFRAWLGQNRPEALSYLNNGTNSRELIDIAEEFLTESENFPTSTNGP